MSNQYNKSLENNSLNTAIEPNEPNDLTPEKWAYLNRPYTDRYLKFEEWIEIQKRGLF